MCKIDTPKVGNWKKTFMSLKFKYLEEYSADLRTQGVKI